MLNNDVFFSAADDDGMRAIDCMLEEEQIEQGFDELPNGGNSGFCADGGGQFTCNQVPSYRYNPQAMLSPRYFALDENANPADPNFVHQSFNSFDTYFRAVRRNPISDVSYPSSCVMFWMYLADHNKDLSIYWDEGASVPMAFADGSVGARIPSREAIPVQRGPNGDNPEEAAEGAGPYGSVVYTGQDGTQSTFPLYFLWTCWGIQGRDF